VFRDLGDSPRAPLPSPVASAAVVASLVAGVAALARGASAWTSRSPLPPLLERVDFSSPWVGTATRHGAATSGMRQSPWK
jgi:hypothetical protein